VFVAPYVFQGRPSYQVEFRFRRATKVGTTTTLDDLVDEILADLREPGRIGFPDT
jgi:hypothetical protein